ncbi:hypothetical protein AB0D08_06735 [Kitasatospora sp. NPDC048540]|uniref:hypothetical protein n=1 Tax=Kitasatospora sp. NPDC048540 TaxID=3155634 RepID=UPI0034084B69
MNTGIVTATAQLLLTDDTGRVLLTNCPEGGAQLGLPGTALAGAEPPAQAARRAALIATGLAHLTAGALLVLDGGAGTSAGVAASITFVFDHAALTPHQVAALGASTGWGRCGARDVRLVAAEALAREAPEQAGRILAALRARVDGLAADLEDGRPRAPRVLDALHVLGRRAGECPESMWRDGRTNVRVGEVRGWCFVPDGRVVLVHDPLSGCTVLPGGPLAPDAEEDPARELGRLTADSIQTMISPRDRHLTGHRIGGRRGLFPRCHDGDLRGTSHPGEVRGDTAASPRLASPGGRAARRRKRAGGDGHSAQVGP